MTLSCEFSVLISTPGKGDCDKVVPSARRDVRMR